MSPGESISITIQKTVHSQKKQNLCHFDKTFSHRLHQNYQNESFQRRYACLVPAYTSILG